jgi:hypothetical protein
VLFVTSLFINVINDGDGAVMLLEVDGSISVVVFVVSVFIVSFCNVWFNTRSTKSVVDEDGDGVVVVPILGDGEVAGTDGEVMFPVLLSILL